MNLERCESYAREVQAIFQQCIQLQGQLDQFNGILRIAQEQGNMDQVRKIDEQRKLVREAITATEKVLYERTARASMETVREFVADFFSRLQLAVREFEKWRMAKAELEFQLVTEEGVDRAEEQRKIDVYRRRYEQCVQMAAEYVPEKPIIIIP